MAQGFVVDQTYGANTLSHWYDGKPEKSIWTGLKLKGRAKYPIATWRCGRCGFLESYAT